MSRPTSHPVPRSAPRRSSRPTSTAVRRPSAVSPLESALAAAGALAPTPAPSFAAMRLPERLVTALARRGVHEPFAIQGRAIPDGLAGRDVLGRAQTGSGKTLAFGLPMLARLAGGRRAPGRPRGLVVVPTRELAEQVKEALAPLGQALDLQVTAIYGGASMHRQITALRRGVDLVIATPGRLQDLINQRECSLDRVEITVLDEADYLADLGFLPAVRALLDATPAKGQRLLFSATLDRGVDRLVNDYLTDPAIHAITPAGHTVSTMDHRAFTIRPEDKLAVAAQIAARPGRTLLFVRTKHGADRLAKQLQRAGVDAGALHGNLAQNARQRALDAFSSGQARVLVATDVAARGIHVDDVDLVVHFDPPADAKDYLHRSGRTARAGADGVVLSLLLPEQVTEVARLHRDAGVHAVAAWVSPTSPAVQELAESGTPITVLAPVAPPPARPPVAPRRHRQPAQRHRRAALPR
jgi:superfamily II DNA/RNA helicase